MVTLNTEAGRGSGSSQDFDIVEEIMFDSSSEETVEIYSGLSNKLLWCFGLSYPHQPIDPS